jgi:hypothetical protein
LAGLGFGTGWKSCKGLLVSYVASLIRADIAKIMEENIHAGCKDKLFSGKFKKFR